MPQRFSNRHGPDVDGRGVARWIAERIRRRLPPPPSSPVKGIMPDLALLHGNRDETTLTWIGHSTLLFPHDGLNILTDPMFSRFASPVPFAGPRRHQPPGVPLSALPRIDVVVLSHSHYDHLDAPSVKALQRQAGGPPRWFVPAGTAAWFARQLRGADVQELAWDEVATVPGATAPFELHFLAVQHWSNRSAFRRNDTLWGSWAVIHPNFRFWFSGDLGYSKDTKIIGEQFGHFDLAAIAIGAYEPRWFMAPQHINPDEAITVMRDVGAAQAMGIHWGTFALTDEPLDQPPRDLAVALAARMIPSERFAVYRHGETRRYARAGDAGTSGDRRAR